MELKCLKALEDVLDAGKKYAALKKQLNAYSKAFSWASVYICGLSAGQESYIQRLLDYAAPNLSNFEMDSEACEILKEEFKLEAHTRKLASNELTDGEKNTLRNYPQGCYY